MRVFGALAAILWTTAAAAQDSASLTQCFDKGYDEETCVWMMADPCLGDPANASSQAQSQCMYAEATVWENLLAAEYAVLQRRLEELDTTDPMEPSRMSLFAESQTSWQALRDIDCLLTGTMLGSGTMAQGIIARCIMTETADRAIHIRSLSRLQ